MSAKRVGTVVGLSRYPVKSMRAEPLATAAIHWPWLHGDRQYAFVRADNTSAFPWLTARDIPDLVRFAAHYDAPDDPVHSGVTVTDPDGDTFDIRDDRLLSRLAEAARTPVRLLRLGRGCMDSMPVSVLSTATVAEVERVHGAAVAATRFRANVIVEPDDPDATEAGWLGHRVAFGAGAVLRLGWTIPRCAMIGIDAETGQRDPTVVRTVVQRFGNRVGAYGSVDHPGSIAVGDVVTIAEGDAGPL